MATKGQPLNYKGKILTCTKCMSVWRRNRAGKISCPVCGPDFSLAVWDKDEHFIGFCNQGGKSKLNIVDKKVYDLLPKKKLKKKVKK